MTRDTEPTELTGGTAHVGQVTRSGEYVTKPSSTATPSVHRFLSFLNTKGCEFVPQPVGIDDDRQTLTFIDGIVIGDEDDPPPWITSEEVLVAVARMQRRLHDHARGYQPRPGSRFDVPYVPSTAAGSLMCHNDLSISNVVFTDRVAPTPCGFIDFDYAAPVDPLFDIAVAVRHWVPMWSPDDLHGTYSGVDQRQRFDTWVDVLDIADGERQRLLRMLSAYVETVRGVVLERAAAGQKGFAKLVDRGYEAESRRTSSWLAAWS